MLLVLLLLLVGTLGVSSQSCEYSTCASCAANSQCYWCGSAYVGVCTTSSTCVGGGSLPLSSCPTNIPVAIPSQTANVLLLALPITFTVVFMALVALVIGLVYRCRQKRRLRQQKEQQEMVNQAVANLTQKQQEEATSTVVYENPPTPTQPVYIPTQPVQQQQPQNMSINFYMGSLTQQPKQWQQQAFGQSDPPMYQPQLMRTQYSGVDETQYPSAPGQNDEVKQ